MNYNGLMKRKANKIPKSILRMPMGKRALMALREAVDGVIQENARLGLRMYIGKDEKVVKLSPRQVRKLARQRAKRRT
jgi:hypothetical protein